MWLAFLIVLAIALCIAGLIWGVLWIAVPAILLLLAGIAFQLTVMRSSGDSTGRLEKGPAQDGEGRGQPEDEPGGSGHEATGYAHRGQRHMTP